MGAFAVTLATFVRFATTTVEIHARKHLTERQKQQRWEEVGRCCTICGEPCEASGPAVIWDHRIPLALAGTNDLTNFEPHHNGKCSAWKTRNDKRMIAKAKRIQAKIKDDRAKRRKIIGRGFQKNLTRSFDGKVRERK